MASISKYWTSQWRSCKTLNEKLSMQAERHRTGADNVEDEYEILFGKRLPVDGPVDAVLRHTYEETPGRPTDDPFPTVEYTVTYNETFVSIPFREDGASPYTHDVYCPFCDGNVPLKIRTGKDYRRRQLLAWIYAFAPATATLPLVFFVDAVAFMLTLTLAFLGFFILMPIIGEWAGYRVEAFGPHEVYWSGKPGHDS